MNQSQHKKLDAWQKSMDLVTEIYKVTAFYPIANSTDYAVKCGELRAKSLGVWELGSLAGVNVKVLKNESV